MRFPFRLHLLFGAFTILAAFVAGLISPPSPVRQNVAGRGIERTRRWNPPTCRIRITVGGQTRIVNGALLGNSEILSARVELDSAKFGPEALWPNSFSEPETFLRRDYVNHSVPIVAEADVPGLPGRIPLRVAAFSDEMALYRFAPEVLAENAGRDASLAVPSDLSPGTPVLGSNGEITGIRSRQGEFYPIRKALRELKVVDPPRDLK